MRSSLLNILMQCCAEFVDFELLVAAHAVLFTSVRWCGVVFFVLSLLILVVDASCWCFLILADD